MTTTRTTVGGEGGAVTFYAAGLPLETVPLCEDVVTLADAWNAGGLTFQELRRAIWELRREFQWRASR